VVEETNIKYCEKKREEQIKITPSGSIASRGSKEREQKKQ
jgi:hypothetical protein